MLVNWYIVPKHFTEEYEKHKRHQQFISLPMSVEVKKYDCDLRPYIHKRSELVTYVMPASITYFTPVLDSEKDVVYVSEKAKKLLIDFIEASSAYETIKEGGKDVRIRKTCEEMTEKDWDDYSKRW